MGKKHEVMDEGFSLFNCHVNDAEKRASKAFTKRFGPKAFHVEIQPYLEDGVMDLRGVDNKYTRFFIAVVFAFVNEKNKQTKEQAEKLDQAYTDPTKCGVKKPKPDDSGSEG